MEKYLNLDLTESYFLVKAITDSLSKASYLLLKQVLLNGIIAQRAFEEYPR